MKKLFFTRNGSAYICRRSRCASHYQGVVAALLVFGTLNIPIVVANEQIVAQQEIIKLPTDASTVDLSPDGKWMCCWVNAKEGDNASYFLWVSPTKSVHWQRVATGGGTGHWRSDSKLYVFELGYSTSVSRSSGLRVLSVPDKRVQSWWLPFYHVTSPAWSPDGKSIVAFGDQVLRYDKAKKILPPAKPVGGGIFYERLLLINTNGKLINHYSNGMKTGQWSYDSPSSPRWSKDERYIVYIRGSDDLGFGPILGFDLAKHQTKKLAEAIDALPYGSVRWVGNRLIANTLSPEGEDASSSAKSVLMINRSHPRFIATLLDVLPNGKNNFYFAIQQDGPVPYGELWQGQIFPRPRLVKKLTTFPLTSSYPYRTRVFFEAKRRRLWVMSPTSDVIRSVPVSGPYESLGKVPNQTSQAVQKTDDAKSGIDSY